MPQGRAKAVLGSRPQYEGLGEQTCISLTCQPLAVCSPPPTGHGAEADLVLPLRNGQTWVVEIKRSSAPTVSKGFHLAAADVGAIRKLLVAPVSDTYPMRDGIEVMNPLAAAQLLAANG